MLQTAAPKAATLDLTRARRLYSSSGRMFCHWVSRGGERCPQGIDGIEANANFLRGLHSCSDYRMVTAASGLVISTPMPVRASRTSNATTTIFHSPHGHPGSSRCPLQQHSLRSALPRSGDLVPRVHSKDIRDGIWRLDVSCPDLQYYAGQVDSVLRRNGRRVRAVNEQVYGRGLVALHGRVQPDSPGAKSKTESKTLQLVAPRTSRIRGGGGQVEF